MTIDVDDETLSAAARELGTTSKVETVNATGSWPTRLRAEPDDAELINLPGLVTAKYG